MSFDPWNFIKNIIHPYDMWMALWKEYGDPIVPPFPEDILSPVTPVMVPSTPDEITHPDTLVASTNPVLAIDDFDSVQQETPCLPTSTSWDDFLLDIVGLLMDSHSEDVGDIIDDICLLFVEANTSSIAIVIGSFTPT